MSNLSDDIMSAISGMDETFKSATADTDGTSGGQRWPDAGECPAWLKNFSVDLEGFRYDGNEVPGVAYKFAYETMEQADGDDFEFNGAVFRFPQKLDKIKGTFPNNTRARVEIESNRLMGHFTSLLGARPASIAAGAKQVAEMVSAAQSGGDPIGVTLNIVHQKRQYGERVRTFNKEFITGTLSVSNA